MTDELTSDLLPLPPATLHILLALAESERHGYAIIQDVEARTDGELRMSAGTLYRSIARMVEQGLIVEVAKRRTAADDERRRYYHITPSGAAVARRRPTPAAAPPIPPRSPRRPPGPRCDASHSS